MYDTSHVVHWFEGTPQVGDKAACGVIFDDPLAITMECTDNPNCKRCPQCIQILEDDNVRFNLGG